MTEKIRSFAFSFAGFAGCPESVGEYDTKPFESDAKQQENFAGDDGSSADGIIE